MHHLRTLFACTTLTCVALTPLACDSDESAATDASTGGASTGGAENLGGEASTGGGGDGLGGAGGVGHLPDHIPYELIPVEDLSYVSAVKLPDGDVFFAGCIFEGIVCTRVAYRYDLEEKTWTELPSYSERTKHPSQLRAYLLDEERVAVFDDEHTLRPMMQVFELATETWTSFAGPTDDYVGPVTQLADKDILVLMDEKTMVFDAESESWSEHPGRPADVDLLWGGLTGLTDGSALYTGSALSHRLVVGDGAWGSAGSLTGKRLGGSLIGLSDGRALLVGGYEAPDEPHITSVRTELWDPEESSWTKGPDLPASQGTPTLLETDHGVIAIGGSVYPCDSDYNCGGSRVALIDVAAGTTKALPEVPYRFYDAAVVPLGTGEYLIAASGGYFRYSEETGPEKP